METAFPTNGAPPDLPPPAGSVTGAKQGSTEPEAEKQAAPAKTDAKAAADAPADAKAAADTKKKATDDKPTAEAGTTKAEAPDGTKDTDSPKAEGKKDEGKKDEEAAPGKPTRRRKPKLPSTRPPGAPPDPWTAFAETSERSPGCIRRATRVVGRALIHEYALVTYGSLLLAVLLTWPTLRYPMHTFPQDIWDPSLQAWQISWAWHILTTDPARLWQSNAFFP